MLCTNGIYQNDPQSLLITLITLIRHHMTVTWSSLSKMAAKISRSVRDGAASPRREAVAIECELATKIRLHWMLKMESVSLTQKDGVEISLTAGDLQKRQTAIYCNSGECPVKTAYYRHCCHVTVM